MKNYDPNIRWGTHVVKVHFQQWDYKGFVSFSRGGNAKGLDILDLDVDDLYDQTFIENPIGFRVIDESDDWFKMTLKNDKGEELLVEDEWESLGNSIVAIEIVDFIVEDSK